MALGISGLGSTPFGVGTPVSADAPPSDSSTFSRYINPNTGDYLRDTDTGQLAQMPRNRQRVLLALMTEFGSSVAGGGLKAPKKMGTGFERDMDVAIRAALRFLVEEKAIRVEQVIPRRVSTGRGGAIVVYTDLQEDPSKTTDPVVI